MEIDLKKETLYNILTEVLIIFSYKLYMQSWMDRLY
jgi:hypothetical protein